MIHAKCSRFQQALNQKFALVPRSDVDAHRATLPDEGTLDLILSEQHSRKITKNLEVSFQNKIYQIKTETRSYTMRGGRLTVCVDMNDHITLLYKGKTLPYTVYEKLKKVSKVVTGKEINRLVDLLKTDGRARGHKPSANHPWRQYSTSTS